VIAQNRPPFRLRILLNPFYLMRRLREMRSFGELSRTVANVFVFAGGRLKNAYHGFHGIPRLLASRSEAAYYGVRGFPGYLRARGVRLQNVYYDLRGLPRLFAARSEAAYYEVRGFPGYLKARAENFYYKADVARLLPAASPGRPAPAVETPAAPAAPVSFEDRDPVSLLHPDVVREQTALAGRFQAGVPFKHVVIDGLLDPEFCRALTAEFPPYEAAAFRNENGDLGKAHHENVSQLGPSYRKLDQLVQTPEFLRLVSAITGIPDLLYDPEYIGGGAHENLEEMELDPHVDFTIHRTSGRYRRVNLLLYLNPTWEESWGGGLELHVNPWLPPSENTIRTVSPVFNRCILFETSEHSWHGFRSIRLPRDRKGLTRRSFAVYLYTRDKPRGFASIPGDLTVFVDRPLPATFRPGLTLSDEDVRVLGHLIVRRDWKLRYLYDRAIALYNDWQASQTQLGEAREALKRAAAEKAALANDLRLSQSQLRESLEALLRANADKPTP
jgi:hypothetical protein